MSEHTITKKRLSGNVTIRADRKDASVQLGAGTWVNISLRGLGGSIEYAREKAEQYSVIVDELERVQSSGEGANW